MIIKLIFSAILTFGFQANASYCEVSDDTVNEVEEWLYSPLELPYEVIIKTYVIPALKADECIQSRISEDEVSVLAERLSYEVVQGGNSVRDVISEFLAE